MAYPPCKRSQGFLVEHPGYAAFFIPPSTTFGYISPTEYAGYFAGNVHVTGNLSASGAKPFRIDHPLDPENKYLYHYAMESPEILNLYRGTVVLNTDGEAWAELPDYFESINRDFTYQLTAVGAPMPNLHVAQEIDGTRFQIADGKAGLKVSWQLTAVRNDPYVRQYGAPVEAEKPETERGFYQHPELYGQPEERGVEYQNRVEEREPEDERPNERAASNSPEVVEDPLDADKRAKAAEIRRHEQRSETETVRVGDAGAGVRGPADASETLASDKGIATGPAKLSDTGEE